MRRGPEAVTVSTALLFTALCTVVMRFYCRYWLLKRTGADDYLVFAALIFSILLTVCLGFRKSLTILLGNLLKRSQNNNMG